MATPLRPTDPRVLGGYRLEAVLGEGGQGIVYLGNGPAGERVAIKWLRPELAADQEMVRRFLHEVSAAKRVAPFCTAQVIDVGAEDARPYIVSEYIEGQSLAQAIPQTGPRTGNALHRLAIGTATALAAIHQAGIVHRDFKPPNVILGSDGPRVIDFGISKALGSHTALTSTMIGTPAYMAPEQLAGGPIGPAADLFAWAGTIAYAANGRAPFGNDTMPAVINRVLRMQPDLGDIPQPLRGILLDCLNKNPALRPTARQVIDRLLVSDPAAAQADRPPDARAEARVPDAGRGDGRDRAGGDRRDRRGVRRDHQLRAAARHAVLGAARDASPRARSRWSSTSTTPPPSRRSHPRIRPICRSSG